ncbi:unnamed protein product [marine sediment metagenome]|uniref:Uncharacterized protein n=1 Tax=marine sediment metagenome TaxID=412755 RepID=X1AV17_9ZZZZ
MDSKNLKTTIALSDINAEIPLSTVLIPLAKYSLKKRNVNMK